MFTIAQIGNDFYVGTIETNVRNLKQMANIGGDDELISISEFKSMTKPIQKEIAEEIYGHLYYNGYAPENLMAYLIDHNSQVQ